MALFVISLLAVSMVSALDSNDLKIDSVKVNGDIVNWNNDVLAIQEGQDVEVRVGIKAVSDNVKNVQVEAEINGYEHGSLSDSTELTNFKNGTVKYVTLKITLPNDLVNGKDYWLRLRVLDQNTEAFNDKVKLHVEAPRHSVEVADVSFSPSLTVKVGRSLLSTVLLENYAEKTENDVKVTVAVPELGLSASEYVDHVGANDHQSADEMFLQIPTDAKPGEYTVKVTAQYNDLKDTSSKTYTLKVVENDLIAKNYPSKSSKTVLAVGPETQSVAAGKTASYAVALTNDGSASKAYTVEATSGDWATASVSEKLVVLEPGQNKVVYVDLATAKDAAAGEHLASVAVKSGSDVLETVVLKANVAAPAKNAEDSDSSLRNGLEIALVVLVVLLVLLGLVIGFSRLRKDDEGEEKYY